MIWIILIIILLYSCIKVGADAEKNFYKEDTNEDKEKNKEK